MTRYAAGPTPSGSFWQLNGMPSCGLPSPKLPVKDMEMLLLKHVDDCSYQEIARRLGVTAGVVQMRLFRARQKLRELMLAQYPEE